MSELARRIGSLSPSRARLLAQKLTNAGSAGNDSPGIRGGRASRDYVPASFAQSQFWFLERFGQDLSAYNISATFAITGGIDFPVLERCFTEIVRRHETLRTSFTEIEGEPVQRIGGAERFRLAVIDLSGLTDERSEPEVKRLSIAEHDYHFDLRNGPLFRFLIIRAGGQKHYAVFTIHHMIGDGWSMGVLVSNLVSLYEAFINGDPSPLDELPIQYGDYAVWQRGRQQETLYAQQLEHWKRELEGAPGLLRLSIGRQPLSCQSAQGARRRVFLSPDLSEAIKAVAREEKATLFMALLAALSAVLYHHSDQDEIVVGSPVANRSRQETEEMIGCFANMLAFRVDLSRDPTMRELIRRVRETALRAFANQDLPFVRLVKLLVPERGEGSRHPIFQVALVLQNAPMPPIQFSGMRLKQLEIDGERAKFEITLTVEEQQQRLVLRLEYMTDLFDESDASSMLSDLELILTALAERPSVNLSEVRARLAEAARQRREAAAKALRTAHRRVLERARRKAIEIRS